MISKRQRVFCSLTRPPLSSAFNTNKLYDTMVFQTVNTKKGSCFLFRNAFNSSIPMSMFVDWCETNAFPGVTSRVRIEMMIFFIYFHLTALMRQILMRVGWVSEYVNLHRKLNSFYVFDGLNILIFREDKTLKNEVNSFSFECCANLLLNCFCIYLPSGIPCWGFSFSTHSSKS